MHQQPKNYKIQKRVSAGSGLGWFDSTGLSAQIVRDFPADAGLRQEVLYLYMYLHWPNECGLIHTRKNLCWNTLELGYRVSLTVAA